MKKKKTSVRKATAAQPKKKAASKKPVARVRDAARQEEIDGCDVAIAHATLDHELPAAKGGVN